jgi:hypothetical protein
MLGNDEDIAMFARKGVFPYEWLDSPDKLAHPHFPAPEAFFSELSGSGISEANYEQARWVWDRFGCRTFVENRVGVRRCVRHQPRTSESRRSKRRKALWTFPRPPQLRV